jgi:glycosyltransferase involved in cell wall biosynthesis
MSRSLLHLIRTLDPERGGPVTFLKQLSAVHAAMGIRVAILTLDRNESAWMANLPVSAFECSPSPGGYGYNPSLENKLTELAGTFDTMVVHGLWQFHGFCAMRASARIGVPYFVFPHGMLDPWFRRSYPIKHLKKQLYWVLAERRVLQGAKAVLFTSENESRLAKDTFLPEARYRGRILPLGVERNPAVPDRLRELFFKEFPHLRDRRFLLFLGRLHPKKGCDLLIKAMARIRPPIDLVFAGPISNKEYVCKLKRSAEELPIVFAGMLHGDIKSGALAAAEALILPSHQENFGLVVAEALSFGTPALLSDRVAVAEDVVSSGAGFMEPDTLIGTERLIERWLQEGTLAMRTSALNCFQKRFDIKHSARELMRILFSDG